MTTMKPLIVTALSIGALCAISLVPAGPATAETPAGFSNRLCVPMPEMLAFIGAFHESALHDMAQADSSITVTPSGQYYLLKNGSGTIVRIEKPPSISVQSCRIFPDSETLKTTGSIEAAQIDAFGDVTRYRKSYTWPLGAVDANPDQVDVAVARHGRYIIVSLADHYLHKGANGAAIFGCAGVEYYRVQTSSGEVLPFDGCVESHTKVLPRLSQLP